VTKHRDFDVLVVRHWVIARSRRSLRTNK
jgi:hypothetical protein